MTKHNIDPHAKAANMRAQEQAAHLEAVKAMQQDFRQVLASEAGIRVFQHLFGACRVMAPSHPNVSAIEDQVSRGIYINHIRPFITDSDQLDEVERRG